MNLKSILTPALTLLFTATLYAAPAPSPLYTDPVYNGAADPSIIYHRKEKKWHIFYTQRRANIKNNIANQWIHGCDIGITVSEDGQNWTYNGIAQGLKFEKGKNTFWAPEVIYHDGMYHMYVSYVRGIPKQFGGQRHIIHYTSKNLKNWKLESVLNLSSDKVIDACVHKMPSGQWRMWYKDEANNSYTYAADSNDLYNWTTAGPVLTDFDHEAPNVFKFNGFYWIAIDTWKGIGIYKSTDAQNWTPQPNILTTPGTRKTDKGFGQHPDILVQDDTAWIFYFTYPQPGAESVLQVAKLEFEKGLITCDRNKTVDFKLNPPK